MEITTDFKVGKTTPRSWAQVYGYKPDDRSLLEARGMIVAVMSIASEIDFDLPNVGNWLFDELQESYYGDDLGTTKMLHFEEAIKSLKTRLDNILAREQELAQTGIDLELAVSVIIENALFVAVVGESRVFVYRQDQTADISKVLVDPTMDGFMRVGSMLLEADDRIMLTTSKVLGQNDEQKVNDALSVFNLESTDINSGAAIMCGYELHDAPAPKVVPAEEPVAMEPMSDELLEPTPEMEAPEERVQEFDQTMSYADLEGEIPATPQVSTPPVEMEEDWSQQEDFDDDYMPMPVTTGSAMDKFKQGALPMLGKLKVSAGKGASFIGQKVKGYTSKDQSAQMRMASVYDEPMDHFSDQRLTNNQYIPPRRQLSDIPAKAAAQRVLWGIESFIAMLRGGSRGRGASKLNWRVLSVVILVILAALFFGIRKVSDDRAKAAQVQGVQTGLADLNSRYQSLSIQVNTVTSSTTDSQKQTISNQLDSLINDGNTLLQQNISTAEITKVVGQAQAAKDQLLGIEAFTQPQLVNDLGANFAGSVPTDLIYLNGSVYVVDKAKGSIYRMGTAISSEATAITTGLTQPYLMALNTDGNIIVIDHNTDSVLASIDPATGAVEREPGLSESKVGTLAAMDIWSNGALYSINADKQDLLKQENFSGFQFPDLSNPWRQDADFKNATDMAVDYWMYVVIKGKGLQRYLAGEPAPFSFTGISATDQIALNQVTAMDITATHLYLADPVNKRVMSFIKDVDNGDVFHYEAQYVYRGSGSTFSNIKEISVNETNKQMFVLDGAQVIRVDL